MARTMSIKRIVQQSRSAEAPSVGVDAERRASWAPIALDAIRLVRVLRAEAVAASELLSITLGLLRTAERDRARARESMIAARDEARMLRAELAARRAADVRPATRNLHGTATPQAVVP
jgi:hypothetical protein